MIDETAIPEHALAAACRASRYQLLALINEAVARSGLTSDEVAIRLGCSRRWVERVWTGRVRLTLNIASKMLWVLEGSILRYEEKP